MPTDAAKEDGGKGMSLEVYTPAACLLFDTASATCPGPGGKPVDRELRIWWQKNGYEYCRRRFKKIFPQHPTPTNPSGTLHSIDRYLRFTEFETGDHRGKSMNIKNCKRLE